MQLSPCGGHAGFILQLILVGLGQYAGPSDGFDEWIRLDGLDWIGLDGLDWMDWIGWMRQMD